MRSGTGRNTAQTIAATAPIYNRNDPKFVNTGPRLKVFQNQKNSIASSNKSLKSFDFPTGGWKERKSSPSKDLINLTVKLATKERGSYDEKSSTGQSSAAILIPQNLQQYI